MNLRDMIDGKVIWAGGPGSGRHKEEGEKSLAELRRGGWSVGQTKKLLEKRRRAEEIENRNKKAVSVPKMSKSRYQEEKSKLEKYISDRGLTTGQANNLRTYLDKVYKGK